MDRAEVKLHVILTSALNGGEWSAAFWRFHPSLPKSDTSIDNVGARVISSKELPTDMMQSTATTEPHKIQHKSSGSRDRLHTLIADINTFKMMKSLDRLEI